MTVTFLKFLQNQGKRPNVTQVSQTGNLSEVVSERSDFKIYMSDFIQPRYNQFEAEGLPPRTEVCSDVVLMSTVTRCSFIVWSF